MGGGGGGAGPEGQRVWVDGGSAGEQWNALLERSVLRVLEHEGAPDAEISLALLDDDAMRRLNREHLGRDRPTDVLAFPLWSEDEPFVVGDIYVGLGKAERQAADAGIPLTEELVRLAVHGTLHVLGWDHPETAGAREASPMFRRQEELVEAVLGEIDANRVTRGAEGCGG